MTPLVVLVEFRVEPKDHDEFQRLLAENAAASRRREPGCKQFDVLVPEGAPTGVFILYEIYDDDAAFKAHLQSDHYLQFEKVSAAMILERTIKQLRLAEAEPAAPHWARV
ncbi:MAG TPA: putative quinol monooxygenase [Roseiarcus sp.]|nr:putative quinol monooxygenase [Roseiarcus sp.]